jgi:hypothetical protein
MRSAFGDGGTVRYDPFVYGRKFFTARSVMPSFFAICAGLNPESMYDNISFWRSVHTTPDDTRIFRAAHPEISNFLAVAFTDFE